MYMQELGEISHSLLHYWPNLGSKKNVATVVQPVFVRTVEHASSVWISQSTVVLERKSNAV